MIISDCENEHDRAGGEETEAGGDEVKCRGPPCSPNSHSEATLRLPGRKFCTTRLTGSLMFFWVLQINLNLDGH